MSPSQELVGEIIVRHTHAWDPWTLVSMKTVYREALPSLSKSDDARGWADGRMPGARKRNEELECYRGSCVPLWSPNSELENPWSHGVLYHGSLMSSCKDGSHAVKLL